MTPVPARRPRCPNCGEPVSGSGYLPLLAGVLAALLVIGGLLIYAVVLRGSPPESGLLERTANVALRA